MNSPRGESTGRFPERGLHSDAARYVVAGCQQGGDAPPGRWQSPGSRPCSSASIPTTGETSIVTPGTNTTYTATYKAQGRALGADRSE
jgi:hypothetical protein